jgi:hypothetical protein
VLAAATVVGVVSGFDAGWAKVLYVIGITLPAAIVPWCLARDPRVRPATAALT